MPDWVLVIPPCVPLLFLLHQPWRTKIRKWELTKWSLKGPSKSYEYEIKESETGTASTERGMGKRGRWIGVGGVK